MILKMILARTPRESTSRPIAKSIHARVYLHEAIRRGKNVMRDSLKVDAISKARLEDSLVNQKSVRDAIVPAIGKASVAGREIAFV